MKSLPEPPLGLNLDETKVPSLVSAFVVTWVLGMTSVCLRITARKLTKNRLWWDDWLIIASLIFSGTFMLDVTCYMAARGGFGKHIWAAPSDGLRVYFLGLFIAEYVYTTSICLVKCSILAFYWRIFGSKPAARLPIRIILGIVWAWGIAVLLVATFQCLPVSSFWSRFSPKSNPSDSYNCDVNVRMFFIANAVPNIVTDILMLLIPVPNIWSMQLHRPQKMALLTIFAIGLFIVIVSLIRLYYVVALDFSNTDVTWLFSEEMMWTGIEVNVATVCACLPSMKPILNIALYGTAQHSSQRPAAGSHSVIVTIGGSGESRKRDRIMRLCSPDSGTSTVHITSKDQQPDLPILISYPI